MSEPRIRPDKTIADILASGEKLEPLAVYIVFTDWAEKTVDICIFIRDQVLAGEAKGRIITAGVQQHIFYMIHDLLQDLRTDMMLLATAPYEHLLRRLYVHDAQEIVKHIDLVFSNLSQSASPRVLAHVIDESIATPLLDIVNERASTIESYEKRKQKESEAMKIITDTQRQTQKEIEQALAEFKYKSRAVRAKEETLVGV